MKRPSILVLVLVLAFAVVSCSDDPGGTEAGQGWTRLSPQALNDLMAKEDVYLVNVHEPYEGEIGGTDAHIAYTELAARMGELPAPGEETLVLYCRSGNMSTVAAQSLVDAGRTGFYELEGGFIAWTEAGLPFEVTPDT